MHDLLLGSCTVMTDQPPGGSPDTSPADGTPQDPGSTEVASGPSNGAGRADAAVRPPWTFLTNHGHVLLAVAQSQDALVSEIAARVGITARATLTILKELEAAGYITRHRVGRRTHYTVDDHQHFRHPANAAHEIGELLAIFTRPSSGGTP
ncbi:winged helix-turn-helix domain-containing protein [Kocuria sp. KH4]